MGDLLTQAKEKQRLGDSKGAIAVYDQLLAGDPTHIAALGNRAQLLFIEGRHAAALADYTALLEVDPSNYAALTRRAELLVTMGEDKQAIADYDLLLTHVPDDPELLNARGAARLRLGLPREALMDIQAALAKRPRWEDALLNRAAAHYSLDDFKLARADYETVLRLNPANADALNGVGLILQFSANDLAGAEVQFRKALHHDPANADAWYNIAFMEASKGQTLKAIDDFGEVLRLDSGYVNAYLNRGLLYMNVRLRKDAITHFATAVTRQPGNAHAHLLLGWARCEDGDRMKGCLDLTTAKELGDKHAEELIGKYCR